VSSDTWIHIPEQEAEIILARLQALSAAAKTFGSAVAQRDIQVVWKAGGEEEANRGGPGWRDPASLPNSLEVDLERAIGLLSSPPDDLRERQTEAFKAGFLHRLGHILFSEPEIEIARAEAARGDASGAERIRTEALSNPQAAPLLAQIWVALEEGRVDRRLMDRFRGARRYLEGHRERARTMVAGPPGISQKPPGYAAVTRLTAALFLIFWEGGGDSPDKEAPLRTAEPVQASKIPRTIDLSPEAQTVIHRLRPSLEQIARGGSAADLKQWVENRLAPELETFLAEFPADSPVDADLSQLGPYLRHAEPEDTQPEAPPEAPSHPPEPGEPRPVPEPGGTEQTGEDLQEEDEDTGTTPSEGARTGEHVGTSSDRSEALPGTPTRGGDAAALSDLSRRAPKFGPVAALASEPILYPHTGGTMVVDEIPVGNAHLIPQTERVASALEKMSSMYGPPALDAFGRHSSSLRQALQVNYERTYSGRYRTGRRVGLRNMRRMMSSGDIRLFQRLEVPDRLSYYFHLLVDISPSMYTQDNLHKAIATGYAFASVLTRVRVPVDVSLYSSSFVRLYDHSRDVLEDYFGRRYGFLSAGTCEIEAIAYAKILADQMPARNKIIAVITDGISNGPALGRSGGSNLRRYYTFHLVPWLERSGIDLLSLNLADAPAYHPNTVKLTREWDSVHVLGDVLGEIIREGRRRHEGLWQ